MSTLNDNVPKPIVATKTNTNATSTPVSRIVVEEFTPTQYNEIMKHLNFYADGEITGLMN